MIQPNELHKRIIKNIGEYEILINHREGSKRTGVWKIRSLLNQRCYYVKTHSRKSRWHPEVFAYRNWISEILPYAPELIESFEGDDWQGILITSLDGVTMREANLSRKQEEEAYYKAGELTKLLHTKFKGTYFGRPDCNGNPIEIFHHTDPVYYIKKSLIDLYEKGKKLNCFNSKESFLAEWAIENVDIFKSTHPVPISWDSTPNNWLINKHGEFIGMIDFENMLWGIPADNFTILFERYFPQSPKGKEAFFRGYGLNDIKDMKLQIKITCIKMGLADLVWGLENKDDRVIKLGKQMLEYIDEFTDLGI
ncbi:aminoglycoside phosphotransferase family protein [Caloranaerobacter ferrireducens]|uniref:aminoglycoside phosphotransferase family protein n=1 Tax=Caloranaerobacter ferrireducens TaxID=1323370 RepID=UPI00084CFCB6|nr:aminoglycoside phosphotransferase family protein [Caloranaerobacter ferrireducens]